MLFLYVTPVTARLLPPSTPNHRSILYLVKEKSKPDFFIMSSTKLRRF